jgi:hypothetical protein
MTVLFVNDELEKCGMTLSEPIFAILFQHYSEDIEESRLKTLKKYSHVKYRPRK